MMRNFKNRTLFHGDNLDFMRAMNSECVDLIATDPPFNKGKDFHATPDSLAAGAKFQDRWSWEADVHPHWVDQIRDDHPKLMEAIESARFAHSDGMGAFMCYMAVRLLEMRRLLKPTGSIYLHCDPTASHYLKAIMDAIFGYKNFINEVIWSYNSGGGSKKHFGRKHDVILFYSKTNNWNFNADDVRVPYDAIIPKKNQHLFNEKGKVSGDVWNIKRPPNHSKEWLGYPTQKPVALYERILKASSNEGDVVLDPFCGCATTLVAAENLDRQWVGVDIWEKAHEVVRERMKQTVGVVGDITFTDILPNRTDDEDNHSIPYLRTINKYKQHGTEPWELLTRTQIRDELLDAQDNGAGLVRCAGCGRELEKEFTELDHITPKSDRGSNDISNRILLCRPCNGKKSNGLTMVGLLKQNKKDKWMHSEQTALQARQAAEARYLYVRHEKFQANNLTKFLGGND